MKKKFRGTRMRVTYANVVATLALFIALGGVSWAAATAPKNSVASKSIKKNAVTSVKIKSNAVTGAKVKNRSLTGSDIKNDSLTGAQINEGTLGTVPSATTAGSAGSAENVISVFKKAPASDQTGAADYNAALAAAPQVPLVSHGQASAYGKCFLWNGMINWTTIVAFSANYGTIQGYSVNDTSYQVGPTTPETDRQIESDDASGDEVDDNYAQSASLIGADGKGMQFNSFSWAKIGNPTDGGSYIGTNECAWQLGGTKTG
jgi:hypothetical protein